MSLWSACKRHEAVPREPEACLEQAYKFRLYPTHQQRECLQKTLDACRTLYNAALTERRDAYHFHVRQDPNYYDEPTRKERSREIGINYYSQAHQLPEIKDLRKHTMLSILRSCKMYSDGYKKRSMPSFARCKRGATPGYPRFQGKGHYNSFTYPQAGFSLTHDNRVCLSKIGSIKVKLHREIKGTIKTCTIKREGDALVCRALPVKSKWSPSEANHEAVGIDLGLAALCHSFGR